MLRSVGYPDADEVASAVIAGFAIVGELPCSGAFPGERKEAAAPVSSDGSGDSVSRRQESSMSCQKSIPSQSVLQGGSGTGTAKRLLTRGRLRLEH